MDERLIDLDKSVYDLCMADQQIAAILQEAGFSDVTKPGMINTVGRFMTIPKGAAMRHVDLNEIKRLFQSHGYKVMGGGIS